MPEESFPKSRGRVRSTSSISVRVNPVNYLIALLLASFFGAFLIYLGFQISAYIFLLFVWVLVPFLALTDKVVFDGRRIRRTGFLPGAWARLTSTRDRIKLVDIEQVQTSLVRTIKRGGNLTFMYRTSFVGKGKVFAIQSGHRNYRKFVDSVLPKLSNATLDHRSIDLRDHLNDRFEVRRRATAFEIPSTEVLESGLLTSLSKGRRSERVSDIAAATKATELHTLANQLRVTGLLPQAIEAFRRATVLTPGNARLLFDFATCLRSYGASHRDLTVERRALAMMRLAERRAGDDGDLLTDIGEGYFQFGEWRRAGSTFRKAIERAGQRFRSVIGLAELALHEGKIAHVIHNFSVARELAETPATRRWTSNEIDYFSKLNSDEEYMELEISRMNLLDTLALIRGSALRIAMVGFPVIVIGILFEEHLIANIGWAVSLISFGIWGSVILLSRMLSARIPHDLVENDRQ